MTRKLTDRALPERLPTWGVLLLESHHSPKFTMEWRTHAFVKLVYVLNGNGVFHLGQLSEPFQTGDVILVAPGTRNQIEDDPAAASSLYVCCIAEALLRFDSDLIKSLRTQVFRDDIRFANRIASALRRMVHLQEVDTSTKSVAMVAGAMKLIQIVCERDAKPPAAALGEPVERETIERYIRELPTRFFDETTIDAAANQLGISRRSFTKQFSAITGETWLHHIRGLAIAHAQKRLQRTNLSITSIAFECGFNDLSTFYRQFKSRCGVSPGEYRAQVGDVDES